MFINIKFESEKPIYTQLVEQIIAGIAKRHLQPGDRLPSVRNMAEDLGINMHTVSKAYQELRDRGFILIHRQRGVLVNPHGIPKADQIFKENILNQLHPLIAESLCRGISKEEFSKFVSEIYHFYCGSERE